MRQPTRMMIAYVASFQREGNMANVQSRSAGPLAHAMRRPAASSRGDDTSRERRGPAVVSDGRRQVLLDGGARGWATSAAGLGRTILKAMRSRRTSRLP